MSVLLFDGRLFADNHQLVIEDVDNDDGVADDYTEAAMRRRVIATPHSLIVLTARNMTVPVRAELHATAPSIDLAAWDHAVEASFDAPSGRVRILGLTDAIADAATARVPAGSLRALILSAGLATLNANGLEGDDRYEVRLWPQPREGFAVRKQWVEPKLV